MKEIIKKTVKFGVICLTAGQGRVTILSYQLLEEVMMRGIKKYFIFVLIVMGTAIIFAGGAEETDSDEVITLRFPHWFFGHGSSFEDWINGAVDEFEANNPNVRVEREQVPFDQYWDKLDIGIAGGDPPDVAGFGPGNLGKYIEAGALLPLNDLIDMDDVNRSFGDLQKVSIPAAATDGQTYALAFDSGFYLPLYRPSVFREAGIDAFPETPEEFIEAAQKLTSGDRSGFAYMAVPGNWGEQVLDLQIWTIAYGGHWAKDGLPNLDSEEVIQAVTFLKTMFDQNLVPKDTDKGTYRQMFGLGNVGMLVDGMWMYGLSVGWDPSAENDFEAAALPFSNQRVAAFYEAHGVVAGTDYPEEAAALIATLSNENQQRKLVELTQLIPPRTSVFTDELKRELVANWPWYETFIDNADNAVLKDSEKMPGSQQVEVSKIWGSYFDRVLFEDMAPAEAMRAAQKEAMDLF